MMAGLRKLVGWYVRAGCSACAATIGSQRFPELGGRSAREGRGLWGSDRRCDLVKFGRLLEPSSAAVGDTGLEERAHVFPAEWLTGAFAKIPRNCCKIEIGTISLGKQIDAKEITLLMTLVDGRQ